MRPLAIAIVGRGRVGRSLARAWRRAGHRVALVAHDSKRSLDADVVLLAVPDRAIGAVAAQWAPRLKSAVVLHAAGALDLEPLRSAGLARVGSLHPLLAIASPTTELDGTFCAIDGAPKDRALLRRLARDAGMRPFSASIASRVRYHLGAVLAANSQAPLLEAATAQLVEAGVSEREARAALAHLAQSAIDAWSRRGGPEGLTGPVARGDAATVQKHLAQLSAGTSRELYLALSRAALELAARRRETPAGLADVSRALRS